jgi:hypothetical protein
MAVSSASRLPEKVECVTERSLAVVEPADDGLRIAQGCYLDELPGLAFGLITLGWIVISLASLM